MTQQIVSLTSQNQISIPVNMSRVWGKVKPKKLMVTLVGEELRIKPVTDFRLLKGLLKSNIKLTDNQLSEARRKFEKKWARKI
ncbi:MAG: hypothetical protein PHP97_03150 [Candidatus Shapirobacteria bacterium]|nr:hypothetical protein [Candidatus Shapirobacteria bacterium]MDD3003261.1 hypothetical protein [Candidatus Shapirobacteria bacterium]MDD4383031.1 hypothetical protein [Candidatus Shapirobacteria bacterium]